MNANVNRRRIGTAAAAALALGGLVVLGGQLGGGSANRDGYPGDGSQTGAALAAWLDYRAGERGDAPRADPALAAWLNYRSGERGDPQSPDPELAAWLDYRAGERAAEGSAMVTP